MAFERGNLLMLRAIGFLPLQILLAGWQQHLILRQELLRMHFEYSFGYGSVRTIPFEGHPLDLLMNAMEQEWDATKSTGLLIKNGI